MKKVSLVIFISFMISLGMGSCTKTVTNTVTRIDTVTNIVTDTVKPTPTIIGIWVGTYQITDSTNSYALNLDIGPDSSFIHVGIGADGNTYYGEGTYSLLGTNFTYSFTTLNLSQNGAIQTGTGVYNPSLATITGSWLNQGTSVGGTFLVTKSQ